MLRPNQRFILQKAAGNDRYGQTTEGRKSQIRGSIVKFEISDVKSSVRTDSSASRGNAHEFQADAIVLIPASVAVVEHDILIIRGVTLRIMQIHQRFDASGRFDHNECKLSIWTQ